MSTSTASPTSSTRACSTAGCPPSPIPARCGSPAASARWRASSAMPRKSTTSASRSTTRCGASTGSTSPITARCAACSRAPHRSFGAAVLIDCHSMPSTAGAKDERPRADVVLGDRYGTSCVGVIADLIERTLRDCGYSVSRNKPYAGGFITEHYGNPAAGLHAIQLEINRALYMDERRYERSPTFAQARRANSRCWPSALAADPARGTAALPRAPPNSAPAKEKGPLAVASGPSLGRKRPRRAAVAQALPHCNNIRRGAQNTSPVDLFFTGTFTLRLGCNSGRTCARKSNTISE